MENGTDLFWFVLGLWWLAIVPGCLFFASVDAICDWIYAKADEIRRRCDENL